MPSLEDIESAKRRLAQYRRNLAQLLQQHTQYDAGVVPLQLTNGIDNARVQIQELKARLRGWNVAVEDLPDDEQASPMLMSSSKPGTNSNGWKPWGDHPIVVGIVVVTAIIGVALSLLQLLNGRGSASQSFSYSVRVENETTRQQIPNARVTLTVREKAPLDEVTDTNGFARLFIDAAYVGQPGILLVEATGFKTYSQNIDLDQNKLPQIIQLELIAATSPTQASTGILTTPETSSDATAYTITTDTPTSAAATKTVVNPTILSSTTPTTSSTSTSVETTKQIFSVQGVPQATSKQLSVTVVKVAREGSLVQVTLVAVNEGPVYQADLCYNTCRLISPTRATFKQQQVSAEGDRDSYLLNKIIPQQAPYQFTVSFENVAADVEQITLFEVRGLGVDKPLEFRNLPLPYTLDATSAPPWSASVPTAQQLQAIGTPGQTSKQLSVTVVKVAREGSLVQVTFVAVSDGPAYQADLCYNACRLIDPTGATFKQQQVSAEGDRDSYLLNKIIPQQAPYQFTVSFEGVAADVEQITLFEVRGLGVDKPLEFRNIPLPYTLDATSAPPWSASVPTAQQLQVIATPSQTSKQLSVTVVKVAREGSLVQVTLVAVNEGPAYQADLCYNACRLIDPTGATFKQQQVSAEGDRDSYLLNKIIPQQAPYQFTVSFEGVAADVEQITLFEVRGLGVDKLLEFRNLPLPYQSQ